MKTLARTIAVIANLINYLLGLNVATTLIFRLDFRSIIYINGTSTNESLFINLMIAQIPMVIAAVVAYQFLPKGTTSKTAVTFPVLFELLPLIAALVSIYYAFTGETLREKAVVIGIAVLYAVLSGVIIYAGAAIFQQFTKKAE